MRRYYRQLAFTFKVVTVAAGILYVLTGILFFLFFGKHSTAIPEDLNGFFFLLSGVVILIVGISLITFLPASVKARFKRPVRKPVGSRKYGFITMLAVGVGSTLGSPLFILIPINVEHFAFVSIVSMCIAALLSFAMIYGYSNMFNYTEDKGLETVGAASFTSLGAGSKSVRYFVARVSMWVGNTALAAYSAIIFYEFVFSLLPRLYGASSVTTVIQGSLILVFIAWFILNSFFEKRFIRLIGNVQILLVTVFTAFLLVFGISLMIHSQANFSGIIDSYHGNLMFDILVNTGYLYILFFGFQGILTLNLEGVDSVKAPRIGRLLRKTVLSKKEYLYLAMILTIVIAAIVNIVVALGVFSLHIASSTVASYSIPVIQIAENYLGTGWGYVISAAFMIATITTFIPAFLASSRHLGELARDGYFPQSFADYSWLFTIVFLIVLSVTKPDFLVNITDFTILISLGIIMFSSTWLLRSHFPKYEKWQWISILAGIFTFIFSASLYFNGASIVAFGVLALFLTYIFYDAYELGSVGIQMFLIFMVLSLSMIELLFPIGLVSSLYPNHLLLGVYSIHSRGIVELLFVGLLLIVTNLFVDLYVIRRILKTDAKT